MALVVQKFGGTSVAGPERLQAVARRLVAARERGNDVVGVLSAMGSATDELSRSRTPSRPRPTRASSTCCSRSASGSRARSRRWRSSTSGTARSRSPARRRASSPTPSTRGRRSWRSARERIHEALDAGRDRARRRVPGRLDGVRGDDARPRRLGRDRGCARGGARAPTRARSTPTSRASSRPIRASSPQARKLDAVSYEEMLELAASRREGADAALGRVRPQPRRPHPRTLVVLGDGRDLDRQSGGADGAADHLGNRARHLGGGGDDPRPCPTGRGSRRGSSARSPTSA